MFRVQGLGLKVSGVADFKQFEWLYKGFVRWVWGFSTTGHSCRLDKKPSLSKRTGPHTGLLE